MQQVTISQEDKREWFHSWFDTAFYHKLYADRSAREASAFVEELVNYLEPAAGSTMLDLGCGTGRHSRQLAAKGFNVTGLDLSSASIREAKKAQSPLLHFRNHDMREPFGRNCFDYVFSFFTSFGYFETECEDEQVVRNISSALKEGGTLVLDYINSPYAEKQLVPHETKEIDGVIYQINRHSDKDHFYKKITINDGLFNDLPAYTERVKKFSLEDLYLLFSNYELEIEGVFGDYQLVEYNEETSPRLIIIAYKTQICF